MANVAGMARGEPSGPLFLTGGVDVGSTAIKTALFAHSPQAGDSIALIGAHITLVGPRHEAIDYRNALRVGWARVLETAGVADADVAYVASTGVRDQIAFRVGHFFGRQSQALGARFLFPQAAAFLDAGAYQMRCALIDGDGRVIRHVARRADSDPLIAGGVAVGMLTALRAVGAVVLVGGGARDGALLAALRDQLARRSDGLALLTSPDAVFAGAFGAALLAGRRFRQLARRLVRPLPARRAPVLQRFN